MWKGRRNIVRRAQSFPATTIYLVMLHAVKIFTAHAERWADAEALPWKRLIITTVLLVWVFETYVALRQYRLSARPTPPAALAAYVDLQTYRKASSYSRDKARFNFAKNAVVTAISLALIYADGFAALWLVAGELLEWMGVNPESEILRSIVYVSVMFIVRSIPDIPLDIYFHFVVEEKHGFNKLTPAIYIKDTLISWVMSFLVGAPFIAAIVWIIRWAGDAFATYVAAFLLIWILIAQVLYPLLIQPLFNKLTPLPDGLLRERVFALAGSLEFPLKHVYVIDGSRRSSHSNAYFYGTLPWGPKHIVLYDTLIEKTTPDEVEAVLAHELGHWSHMDNLKLMLVAQLQIWFQMALLALFMHNRSLFDAFGFPTDKSDMLPVLIGMELFQLVVSPLDTVIEFALNAIVRRIEYQADAFACDAARPAPTPLEIQETTSQAETAGVLPKEAVSVLEKTHAEGYADLLKQALVKLGNQNLSAMHNDPLYSAMHHSHPTLAERLLAIERIQVRQCDEDAGDQERKDQ